MLHTFLLLKYSKGMSIKDISYSCDFEIKCKPYLSKIDYRIFLSLIYILLFPLNFRVGCFGVTDDLI